MATRSRVGLVQTALRRQLACHVSRSSFGRLSPSRETVTVQFRRTMASLPSTMKAVVIDKPGGPDVLRYVEDLPLPKMKDDEILVKTEYSGINFIDTYFRSGLYPAPSLPLVLGYEGVGTVASIGNHNPYGLSEGDRVIWMNPGTYATYTSVPAHKLIAIPSDIPTLDAIATHLMGMTALSLITESYPAKKGDHILVHAAAGGVGSLLCQLLSNVGATVIGTASTPQKCEIARQNGASHMINYRDNPDWVPEVRKICPDGVDCVYDGVGLTTHLLSLQATRRKGSVIYFGSASGEPPPLNIQLLGRQNIKIMRAVVMQYIATRQELEFYSGLLFKHLRERTLQVQHKVYALEEARRAHEDLEGRRTSGKLLLKTA